MDSNPLFTHDSLARVVAYRAGRAIEARQLLADATRLARRLPAGRHVLNLCRDRYHFTVCFAACLLSERVSLLPSSHAPQVVERLLDVAPDAFCLSDAEEHEIALPRYRYGECLADPLAPLAAHAFRVPRIADEQPAAIVFTSGSTGVPVPHRKSWGPLVRCVRHGARALGLAAGEPYTVIGTVPPQHMYGLESTVLLPLQMGGALAAEQPFYPADVCAAIDAAARPRALVSTPLHLRALLGAAIDLPPLDLLVCATAPLDEKLACDAERAFRAPLVEIYGSTETGQIATRRTSQRAAWRLLPGVRLRADAGVAHAQGGHIEQATPMCDVLELTGENEFLLHGRTTDLVNVAGKRSSFGYLNAQLQSIPGVIDGAFFLHERAGGGLTGESRLAAVAVAPCGDSRSLMGQLRRLIDPVFLPRPLILLDRLPRNATGKLPQQALQALAEAAQGD